MNEEFYIGQIFEGTYPPAAACWANANHAYIEEIAERRYEIKEVPAPSEAEIIAQRVAELKQKLADSDYAVIKIAEATAEESEALREKYAQVIADRKAWREEINQLENKEQEPLTQE